MYCSEAVADPCPYHSRWILWKFHRYFHNVSNLWHFRVKNKAGKLDLEPITFPWIWLLHVSCLIGSPKCPLMPGKRNLQCFEWPGMHSHIYVAEAKIIPISPVVVADWQCLLADPTLTTVTAIAPRTWSSSGTWHCCPWGQYPTLGLLPHPQLPAWVCQLLLPSGPTSNSQVCDWHPSLCNTNFAVPFSSNNQCWFQDLAFELLCVCIASSPANEEAQQ